MADSGQASSLGRCRFCKTQSVIEHIGAVAATHPGPFHTDNFSLRYCPACDVVFLDPPPSAEDLRVLYRESAQFSNDHYTEDSRVRTILGYLESAIAGRGLLSRPGSRCLEVGAGLAWMSRACKLRDASTTTVAQDVSEEGAGLCPWVDRYYVGEVELLTGEEPFDLISLTHVIEHLLDPLAMLAHLSTRLSPGGRIFVTAPFRPERPKDWRDIDAWKTYSYLHVPAHIAYLSRTWFERFARSAGMALESWDASHENGQAFEAVLGRL